MNELAIRAQNVVLGLMNDNKEKNVNAALMTIGLTNNNATEITIDNFHYNSNKTYDLNRINYFLYFNVDQQGNYTFVKINEFIGDYAMVSVWKLDIITGAIAFPPIFSYFLSDNFPDLSIGEIEKLPHSVTDNFEKFISDFRGWSLKSFCNKYALAISLTYDGPYSKRTSTDHSLSLNDAVIKYSLETSHVNVITSVEIYALSIYSRNSQIAAPTETEFEGIKEGLKTLHGLHGTIEDYSEDLKLISSWSGLLVFLADKINFYSEIETKALETHVEEQKLILERERIAEEKRKLNEASKKTQLPEPPPMKDEVFGQTNKSNHENTFNTLGIFAVLCIVAVFFMRNCSGS